jgi:hypothetical protein
MAGGVGLWDDGQLVGSVFCVCQSVVTAHIITRMGSSLIVASKPTRGYMFRVHTGVHTRVHTRVHTHIRGDIPGFLTEKMKFPPSWSWAIHWPNEIFAPKLWPGPGFLTVALMPIFSGDVWPEDPSKARSSDSVHFVIDVPACSCAQRCFSRITSTVMVYDVTGGTNAGIILYADVERLLDCGGYPPCSSMPSLYVREDGNEAASFIAFRPSDRLGMVSAAQFRCGRQFHVELTCFSGMLLSITIYLTC